MPKRISDFERKCRKIESNINRNPGDWSLDSFQNVDIWGFEERDYVFFLDSVRTLTVGFLPEKRFSESHVKATP